MSLAACAVQHVPVALTRPAAELQSAPRVLVRETEIVLATAYRRTLAAGSRWKYAGRIPQGEVYRPHMDVFTLEGSHVHEAYLVLEHGLLVGFYLPAEQGYSALQPAIPFSLQ